ncbi:30S ribosomal protein S16 [Candidatus Uhrbacteria bacterium CG_4_9_14_3_um_filter_36_7]|uniref:Small ribosomal subunit protein bS16 n=1 Tax=Candidatus Uhrbacteria bacterium CG_4_9_14_3_um_filter_36_7 TaxID=1975033 RepID=A0A2M7XHA7_9BACT|nr:MAG: 30S ribosomal protein S16 [Candidatus Uhrbacteria bacterium CG_4_9_14_3_um_filter_36_7]
MVSIRLTRVGKKRRPLYRIVVMDKTKDPWAKALEILGSRDPRTKETILKEDRIRYWISKGAEVSKTVWNILVDQKIIEEKKQSVTHISSARKKKMEEKQKAGAQTPQSTEQTAQAK